MKREDILTVVMGSLTDIVTEEGDQQADGLGDATPLIGRGSAIDSLGLVELIVEVEQRLSEQGVRVTLADDRAMSQKHSPFRSVGALTDYICQLASE